MEPGRGYARFGLSLGRSRQPHPGPAGTLGRVPTWDTGMIGGAPAASVHAWRTTGRQRGKARRSTSYTPSQ